MEKYGCRLNKRQMEKNKYSRGFETLLRGETLDLQCVSDKLWQLQFG